MIVGVRVMVGVRVGTRVRVGMRVAVGVRVMVGLGPGVAVSGTTGVIVTVSVKAAAAVEAASGVSVGGGAGVAVSGAREGVTVAEGGMTSARVGISVGIERSCPTSAQLLNAAATKTKATAAACMEKCQNLIRLRASAVPLRAAPAALQ